MRIVTALTTAVIVALTWMLGTPSAATAASDDPTAGRLLLMLDASGSMKAKDPSGVTKIEAAKKALTTVVTALPEQAQVGLRVYGATVDGKGKPTPAACKDTQLVTPIGPLDKPALTSTITAIKALGETPIAHSLTQAMTDLGTTGKRNIILVSDGEESCVPDPCPVVTKLTQAGIDLQIDTVGFGVNAAARRQLQCIADAGNGTYYDAKDAAALTTSLSKLSQRALRPFTVSGTPVVGTTAPSGAPELTAGQYTDTLTTGAGRRHYTVRRTIPGSTLRVALTMRPPYLTDVSGTSDTNAELVRMSLDAGAEACQSANATRIGTSHFGHLVTQTVRLPGQTSPSDQAVCATSDTLTLGLDRKEGAATPTAAEIVVMEEPPVIDVDALPAQDDPRPEQTAPAPTNPKPVIGGVSFSSAPTIAPGSWTETFVPGETIFYRVPVGWGQRLRLSVVPRAGSVTEDVTRLTHFNPVLYAPDRTVLGDASLASGSFTSPQPAERASREVRFRNRDSVGTDYADLAGDYFISIAVPNVRDHEAAEVPMDFRVEVEGAVQGAPTYAAASPSPSASPSASEAATNQSSSPASTPEDGGVSPALWAGLGALVVLGAGGAAYAIRRRRGESHTVS